MSTMHPCAIVVLIENVSTSELLLIMIMHLVHFAGISQCKPGKAFHSSHYWYF
uniref:Uncharacterized protein n=1 Tax=Arundo donax TaxID=35708 RepID=A0A0A9B8M9_ARUDO